ncbi:uncharacterized protein Dmoj_GI20431 [Drosophila mojavensis]|uniref:MD-2-related lipid-recognition domain-containing protein n=1 Tax=Drosophila mojavensis TaxID=7230 RepID=B4KQT9_DROMO|nr:uncharacterized protein Dmoj_GI20431 [Drosophila mojavensis]
MKPITVPLLFAVVFVVFASIDCKPWKSKSRLTNLKCTSYDESFAKFEKCKLNVLGRGIIAGEIYISLLKLPINNVHVSFQIKIMFRICLRAFLYKDMAEIKISRIINWSIWRRYNTYQPFLHNSSCNLCELIKNLEKKITFESLVLKAIQSHSNLNHTCPYNHDIIVDNLVFTDEMLQSLPLPQGEYKIQLRFMVAKKWKLMVEAFILRDE